MLSLLSTVPLQALPIDETATQTSLPQQSFGGGAATPPPHSLNKETYDAKVRRAMDEAIPGITEASRLLLHTFFQQEGTRMEKLESLATALPAGTLSEHLSDFFADLVGCVCHKVVPPIAQKVQQDVQNYFQETAAGTKVSRPIASDLTALVSNPFARLWPKSPSPLTGDTPHQEEAIGAEAAVKTIYSKYLEALILKDEEAKERAIHKKQFEIELAKEDIVFAQKSLEEEALTEQKKDLSIAEAALERLRVPPSEAELQFWHKAGVWLEELRRVSEHLYRAEADAAFYEAFRTATPSQPVS
jgi:hypothetical protein